MYTIVERKIYNETKDFVTKTLNRQNGSFEVKYVKSTKYRKITYLDGIK